MHARPEPVALLALVLAILRRLLAVHVAVPLGALLAAHLAHDAILQAMLYSQK